MKRYTTLVLALFCVLIAKAQQTATPGTVNSGRLSANTTQTYSNPTKNYIRSFTYINDASQQKTKVYDTNIDYQYFDGLGRPNEKVQVKASPSGNDVVTLKTYDNYGRPEKSYIPYASTISSNGAFVSENSLTGSNALPDFLDDNYELTGNDDNYGFSAVKYDGTPLNRISQQGAPGEEWQTGSSSSVHPAEISYTTNTSSVASWEFR
jgi:hypothetical protein